MTIAAEGTQLAVISTEHTLFDTTTAGLYIPNINGKNMVSGDEIILRVYKLIESSGGTLELVDEVVYTGPQGTNAIEGIPRNAENQYRYTLEQTLGTGRNFDWEVDSL